MSPGMMTSRQHGGFRSGAYGHTPARNQPFISSRAYSAPRSRYMTTPGEGGGSRITLGPNENVTVGTDADGNVTIDVTEKPTDNSNDSTGAAQVARGGRYQQHQKMTVATAEDGSVTIKPDQDNTLQLVGDPDSNVLAVVELEPAPPVTGNGQNGQ